MGLGPKCTAVKGGSEVWGSVPVLVASLSWCSGSKFISLSMIGEVCIFCCGGCVFLPRMANEQDGECIFEIDSAKRDRCYLEKLSMNRKAWSSPGCTTDKMLVHHPT